MDKAYIVYVPKSTTPNQEYVSTEQLALIQGILTGMGFETQAIEFEPGTTVQRIAECGEGLIFNIAYGWVDRRRQIERSQPEVAKDLEQLEMPLVGSRSRVQALAQDKLLCGRAAANLGIAVPKELTLTMPDLPDIGLVKPRFGACHRGVRIVAPRHLKAFSPERELLQEFIAGEEFTVGVLEINGQPTPLEPIHVKFESSPAIMDWDNFRWRLQPAPRAIGALSEAAMTLFSGLGFRDYARFDFRLKDGAPVLLDANSLPNLHPNISLLPMAAQRRGIDYEKLIETLVKNALHRTGHGLPSDRVGSALL